MKLKTLEKRWELCRSIKKQRGGSALRYYMDAAYCSYVHGASPENYYVLRFFEKTDAERRSFLTSGRSKECDRILNEHATEHEKLILGRKHRFDKAFGKYVHRDFLYAPESDEAQLAEFVGRHEEFFLKPDSGLMGKGIKKIKSAEISDISALFRDCADKKLLLEEPIVQHAALEAITPGCVCTVRINTARGHIIGGCLKCGGQGSVTDNFHSGGVAYPLDTDTGRIIGPGRENRTLTDYLKHPGTEADMTGFTVPYMAELREMLKEACALVPNIGYIGWDVAITPDGPELIEGNFSWPGGNIIQFDDIGKYPLLKKYTDGEKA